MACLAVAAVAAGGAAAAMPLLAIPVQARLAPVAAASSAGHFNGTLLKRIGEGSVPTQSMPSNGDRWRLRWKVSFPSLGRPAAVTLRVAAHGGAPAVTRVLSARCSRSARGTVLLTGSQASRVARGDAVVTVRAGTARLRGTVTAQNTSG